MIRWILHRLLANFEQSYNYDAGYMHRVTDISTSAAIRYMGLTGFTQMKGPVPEIWAGAALASVLEGDCGPCVQLIADQAIEIGVEPVFIRACIARDFDNAGPMGLSFRFAEAAIAGDLVTDSLRVEIEDRFGVEAVLAASYAAAGARVYPVLKRALGHGAACRRLQIAGETISVIKQTS